MIDERLAKSSLIVSSCILVFSAALHLRSVLLGKKRSKEEPATDRYFIHGNISLGAHSYKHFATIVRCMGERISQHAPHRTTPMQMLAQVVYGGSRKVLQHRTLQVPT